MKLKKLTMTLISTVAILTPVPTVPILADETITYTDDYLSFDYPADFSGTIQYGADENGIIYRCAPSNTSEARDYSISIYIYPFGDDKDWGNQDTYLDYFIYGEDNEYFKHEIINKSEQPEVKITLVEDGRITYQKIVAESSNSFVYVCLHEINETPSTIGDQYREIYDSIKVTDTWLESGAEFPEISSTNMIYGQKVE